MIKNLKVSVIQSNLYWEDKKNNLHQFEEKINSISNSDLILLPEMFTTGFTMDALPLSESMKDNSILKLKSWANSSNSVVGGSLIISENDKMYNRFAWAQPNGKILHYDKRHLFRMAGENKNFSNGNESKIFELSGWKIKPQVCYDLRFPVFARNRYKNGCWEYDILIYVANWPKARRNAWMDLLKARAHENQSYIIGINRVGEDGNGIEYSGDSMIIDPKGNVLSSFVEGKEMVETIKLDYQALMDYRQKFPIGQDMDTFIIQ